jgi:uncharacterized protein YgbK (DUF1537 family)
MTNTKIIVLDDDPTGSQTVHSCLLLTRWDPDTLREALCDDAPLFFVLTNTRGMDAGRAAALTTEVCANLRTALDAEQRAGNPISAILVSRSDSTLRGHYPVETDAIAAALGPFDAHFLVPAFFEGGRITRDSVHYVVTDGNAVPAHQTEFAGDSVFGYRHSYLPDYVEEKTAGRIRASEVERFLLADVRGDCRQRLRALQGNACCVVDAETQADLDHFASQLRDAAAAGSRFLFRSAASLLTALAALPPQPVAAAEMSRYVNAAHPGAVVVGSHVQKTTDQLALLLAQPGIVAIEIDVERASDARDTLRDAAIAQASAAHNNGQTPVIYTSRSERQFSDQASRLAFGELLSSLLMDIVRGLPPTLGYLVSKGGITSNDVLSDALSLRTARVLGQVLPGCSVVRCPPDHPRFPAMPVVIFPGNVGSDDALASAYQRMSKASVTMD